MSNDSTTQLTISVKILPVLSTGAVAGPGSVLGCAKIQANVLLVGVVSGNATVPLEEVVLAQAFEFAALLTVLKR